MGRNENIIVEDEIDLKELIRTVVKRKYFILGVTFFITIIAIIYSLVKTPIYEGRALIEIGEYAVSNSNGNGNGNRRVFLDNEISLSKRLNIIFIDLLKNKKDKNVAITKITIPKKTKGFIEIKAEGLSNTLIKQEINKVVKFIKDKHRKILNDIKKRRETEISNINNKILNIGNVKIESFQKDIKMREKAIDLFKSELNDINSIIKKIEKKDSSLAALKIMEKSNLLKIISEYEINLFYMKDQLSNLKNDELNSLIEKKNSLESLMKPYNYKNSNIVGKILINDYPIKPKKKLIVIVSFITALILSIFIVFFLEFIKSLKEEKN